MWPQKLELRLESGGPIKQKVSGHDDKHLLCWRETTTACQLVPWADDRRGWDGCLQWIAKFTLMRSDSLIFSSIMNISASWAFYPLLYREFYSFAVIFPFNRLSFKLHFFSYIILLHSQGWPWTPWSSCLILPRISMAGVCVSYHTQLSSSF